MKLACLPMLFFATLLVAGAALSAEPPQSRLVGSWVLCQDQDNGPKDTLVFYPEGYGFDIRPNKPKTPFLFKEASGQVLLAANAQGNLINIYLTVDPDYTRLTLKSDRTGHVAFYVRSGEEAANACTAK